ncbi:fumarylacetoacetate hydrolase [Pyrrhoderma noxium]|uniref:Fumarylacetoacetate hydrolase n=1 Tax=Pyrrhoderma noxium TaxID=2282107 RepID=A0A286UWA2_9AGAM|nr:fumarylacetoacetate hydrolase [Pyrrhoderma noxium]
MSASTFARTGRKIVAIGRNYAEHVKELNNTVPKEPFFFLKPTTSYVQSGGKIEIPRGVLAHHEVELGVVIGKTGRDIPASQADSYIAGYSLAIDMTARNMQEQVKKKGLPWSAVKGFDTFTPIGPFIDRSSIPDPQKLKLWLKINGAFKQNGTTSDMIFPITKLIEHISSIMTLEEGDLILTGTPSGVGPVAPGDEVTVELSTDSGKILSSLQFTAVQRESGYHFKPE